MEMERYISPYHLLTKKFMIVVNCQTACIDKGFKVACRKNIRILLTSNCVHEKLQSLHCFWRSNCLRSWSQPWTFKNKGRWIPDFHPHDIGYWKYCILDAAQGGDKWGFIAKFYKQSILKGQQPLPINMASIAEMNVEETIAWQS